MSCVKVNALIGYIIYFLRNFIMLGNGDVRYCLSCRCIAEYIRFFRRNNGLGYRGLGGIRRRSYRCTRFAYLREPIGKKFSTSPERSYEFNTVAMSVWPLRVAEATRAGPPLFVAPVLCHLHQKNRSSRIHLSSHSASNRCQHRAYHRYCG